MFDDDTPLAPLINGPHTVEIIRELPALPSDATLEYGVAPSPFGTALITLYEGSLVGVGFCVDGAQNKTGFLHPGYSVADALSQAKQRFKGASFLENSEKIAAFAPHIFDTSRPRPARAERALQITLIGTEFQRKVWRALLGVRWGQTATYGDMAQILGKPKAARAVGTAIGANRIAWVIPCHRVLAASGKLHNYHWGLACKTAMLAFEANNSLHNV